VGEANRQAIPMVFAFTATIKEDAAAGAKDHMLQTVLEWVSQQCPQIMFTLSDKDTSEINAFRAKFPRAKHQLCYWHCTQT
jgi:transposase-like protein